MGKNTAKEIEEKGITVKKSDDIAEWYTQVVLKSGLADYAPVKGCMIIRPYGYAIWQNIMDYFNGVMKKLGVENAYFPLFIPESFFKKEAEHAEGFSPEVAWIEQKEETGERLAVRPTSETIMYDSYSKWIRSYRDLPLRINQWCNVVRWETSAVKMFLRSREFLWQEGHCVYETEDQCETETKLVLKEYVRLASDLLAIPMISGQKTEKEKFAGALRTYTMEAFMPDGKAVQSGTSHNLGQSFGKAFNISFLGRDEKKHVPWQNSWGISTRLIGAMVLLHSDDKGLVLPPTVAPVKAVIVPILFEKTREKVLKKCEEIQQRLFSKFNFEVKLDDRDEYNPGWKFNEWELKGIPVRIEVGPKDLEKNQVVIVRRDTGEKEIVPDDKIEDKIKDILEKIQENMLNNAKKMLEDSIVEADNWDDFMKAVGQRKMIKTSFCGEIECEETIKSESGGVTSRCIPLESGNPKKGSKCVKCGKDAKHVIYFSKSY